MSYRYNSSKSLIVIRWDLIDTLLKKEQGLTTAMVTMFSNNTFLNRIPFENPWISSLIASLIGSAVLVVLGFCPAHPQRGSTGRFIRNLPVQGIHQLCHTTRYVFCSVHAGISVGLPRLPRKGTVEIFYKSFLRPMSSPC
jgi:hypothetical protein